MYGRAQHGERVTADFGYVETDPTGRYGRFNEVLGKGATKTVYRAFDELQGMEVAWNQAKLNDVFRSPEELQRLYSEVHLLGTLNHDSIIRLYASWVDVNKRTINFITEMFTSGTLREYRQRYKWVNIRAVKNWARQILRGLVYLHSHDPPVIHRDLKCDNIFVNGHLGQVKIGDLGLAAILQGSRAAHSVIGTPEFMAPELYEEEYNELVDVYSFGMCVLEMLTAEYPYNECSNPAQIYKKVTSGKLPEAFYRIHDLEARQFVGKCLETASKRSPASELLDDPFLQWDDEAELLSQVLRSESCSPISGDIEPKGQTKQALPVVREQNLATSTDMTITGKMNPEDDTIFLKVQIADKDGAVRNIYFPFDIVSDTAMDVAKEMVKELEITDKEPFEIAKMIDEEISALVPRWKECNSPHHQHHTFNYQDEDEVPHHPFYYPSSPSSSQTSSILCPIAPHGAYHHHSNDVAYISDWLRDESFNKEDDDDASSQSSLHSGKYSKINYNSGNEHDFDVSPRKREFQPNMKNHNSSRFCQEDNPRTDHHKSSKSCKQCKVLPEFPQGSSQGTSDNRRLSRIRSMMDIRSQLLHRSLVEEVNKRRLFKTVGAVENIGFQTPCESPAMASPMGGGSGSMKDHVDGKKNVFRWGRR
eukprot:TRINITY_DN7304_c0_g1_i1.p1 TRINITY_DN7304_c0_g1~~TRINITY_DN7304_c0_g1_i1.p1  ORF type:complete len:648 (-),score=88.48 TRINITY_DN7304_c0_g1_i1:298-2241(-)